MCMSLMVVIVQIAEWGATFNPFTFTDYGASQLTTTLPKDTPSGEYLARFVFSSLVSLPIFFLFCVHLGSILAAELSKSVSTLPVHLNGTYRVPRSALSMAEAATLHLRSQFQDTFSLMVRSPSLFLVPSIPIVFN
jgi:hypothetical protein